MGKIDLKKQFKSYYKAAAEPELVHIEPARFLSIPGKGDPSSDSFLDRVQALYSTAYGVKFMYKEQNQDFVVPKLEGLWWFDTERYEILSPSEAPQKVPRSEWEWRMMIRMPEFVDEGAAKQAIDQVLVKKQLNAAGDVELYSMDEGKAVQIMHTGPFEHEPESLQKMYDFMKEQELVQNGLHHEIYLSDFRRTAPEKLKTILREPVK